MAFAKQISPKLNFGESINHGHPSQTQEARFGVPLVFGWDVMLCRAFAEQMRRGTFAAKAVWELAHKRLGARIFAKGEIPVKWHISIALRQKVCYNEIT
jgi:hypothetical protein